MLTKDTFNTKQDTELLLKNLPNLPTQLDLDVWGRAGTDGDSNYELGDHVLYDGELYAVNDPAVHGLKLEVSSADNLLLHIAQKTGCRELEGDVESLRKAVIEDKRGKYDEHAEVDPLWE